MIPHVNDSTREEDFQDIDLQYGKDVTKRKYRFLYQSQLLCPFSDFSYYIEHAMNNETRYTQTETFIQTYRTCPDREWNFGPWLYSNLRHNYKNNMLNYIGNIVV